MFSKKVDSFLRDENGATAIEYGLIAALVSVAAIAALQAMGGSLVNIFGVVQGELDTASTTASSSTSGSSGGTGGDTSGGTSGGTGG